MGTTVAMAMPVDPKQDLLKSLGDLTDIKLLHGQVLVAVYIRPEKTKGGIILTAKTRDEDNYQSKVGLIVAKGPSAFISQGEWTWQEPIDLHEWVVFRASDGWNMLINNVMCRIISDTAVRMTITDPDRVW